MTTRTCAVRTGRSTPTRPGSAPAPRATCSRPVEDAGGLTDLDEMPVGIAHIRADLAPVILGLGEELDSLAAPFVVHGGDVGDADVEERAGAGRIRWRLEDHVGLVVGRPAAFVQAQPRVGDPHDPRA